jgi:putative oxidoreductase
MFWAVLMARVVLALPFLLAGSNHFLHFMPEPAGPSPESHAGQFAGVLAASGYLNVLKVLELVGGVLVISGRLVPLGLTILTPIVVNILLFEIFMVGSPGIGVVLLVLCLVLIWAYRSHFAALFAVKPRIG